MKHSRTAEFDWANFLAVSYVIKLDIPMQSVVVCEVRNLGIAIIHHPRSKTEENASLWRTTQLAVRGHVQEVKLKLGFHMSEKSEILLIYRIIATSLSQRRDVYVW